MCFENCELITSGQDIRGDENSFETRSETIQDCYTLIDSQIGGHESNSVTIFYHLVRKPTRGSSSLGINKICYDILLLSQKLFLWAHPGVKIN